MRQYGGHVCEPIDSLKLIKRLSAQAGRLLGGGEGEKPGEIGKLSSTCGLANFRRSLRRLLLGFKISFKCCLSRYKVCQLLHLQSCAMRINNLEQSGLGQAGYLQMLQQVLFGALILVYLSIKFFFRVVRYLLQRFADFLNLIEAQECLYVIGSFPGGSKYIFNNFTPRQSELWMKRKPSYDVMNFR